LYLSVNGSSVRTSNNQFIATTNNSNAIISSGNISIYILSVLYQSYISILCQIEGEAVQTVNPIREIRKIEDIKKLIGNKRDLLLFVMGINTALRISDLLLLTLGDIVDERGQVRQAIALKEKKTGKTKEFPLNSSIKQAIKVNLNERQNCAYLDEQKKTAPDSPLFLSRKGNKAISRAQAWEILHSLGERVGLDKIGTHSLRKTFGYQVYQKSGKDIGLVQKLLNHSSSGDTLRYIGITRAQLDAIYLELNL
jgi:integrase